METKTGFIIRSPYAVLEHWEQSFPVSDTGYVTPGDAKVVHAGEFMLMGASGLVRPDSTDVQNYITVSTEGDGGTPVVYTVTGVPGSDGYVSGAFIVTDDVLQHRTSINYRSQLPVFMGPWPIMISTNIYEHDTVTFVMGDFVTVRALTNADGNGLTGRYGFDKLDMGVTPGQQIYGQVTKPVSDGMLTVLLLQPFTFNSAVINVA